MYVLILYARAPRPRPCSSPMACSTAWWSSSRLIWAFLTFVSIVRLVKSLWVGCSKICQNTSCPFWSSPCVARSKLMPKFSMVQIFFIFACRTHMWKLASYKNFPLYGIYNHSIVQYCWTRLLHHDHLYNTIIQMQLVQLTFLDCGAYENW